MKIPFFYSCTVALLLILSGCAQQTSVDRHTVHAAHRLAEANFDPNTRLLVADSIRMMRPCFAAVYQHGLNDRAAGISRAEMEDRAAEFLNPDNLSDAAVTHRFLNQHYLADRPEKERKILAEALSAVYRDGYERNP